MKKSPKHQITLALILFLSSICLIQAQFASRYKPQLYENELLERQKQFDFQMQNIDQQVAELDEVIQKYEGNDTYQIMKLQEGLADERDSLYDVEYALNEPFKFKPCEKPNLSEEEKAEITQKIRETNESLFDMKAEVKVCTKSINECTVSDELIHQITRAELYLAVMNDYVNGNCMRVPRKIADEQATGLVDLHDRLYKDNLKAPNWIYGNITEEQYRLIVFAETTKYNLTTCPIETPYSNKFNNTCFNCPPGSIFSLGERTCNCPEGYRFEESTSTCVSLIPVKPCNETGTCASLCPKDKPHWNSLNKICEQCPPERPVVNKEENTCEPCPQETPLWNQVTYECEECPENTHWVAEQNKCVPCEDDERYNEETKKCVPICKQWEIYVIEEGKCYTLEELYGCKCNQRYNNETQECQDTCKNGLQWLASDNKCGPPALPDFEDECKYHQRPNLETGECENYCDSSVAFYDREYHVCIKIGCGVECKCGEVFENSTGNCIPEGFECEDETQFYNTTSGQCEIPCEEGTFFNIVTGQCEEQAPEPVEPIEPEQPVQPEPKPEPETPTCPSNQYYNVVYKTCVDVPPVAKPSCAVDEYFSEKHTRCLKKCKWQEHKNYNFATQECDCLSGYSLDRDECILNELFCKEDQHQVYSYNSKKCICMPGYTPQDPSHQILVCISIESTCRRDKFEQFDPVSNSCECVQGYYRNLSKGQCLVNPVQCDRSLFMVANPQTNKCVCMQGYRLESDGLCNSVCHADSHMQYNPYTKSCECMGEYFPSPDNNYCLHISTKCQAALNMFYNESTKVCQCNSGYFFNDDRTVCLSEASKCSSSRHQIFNIQTKQCDCMSGYMLRGGLCISEASQCDSNRHQVWNSVSRVCQCASGFILKNGACISQSLQCNANLHFVWNPQSRQCQCQNGYTKSQDGSFCQSYAQLCLRGTNTVYNSATFQCQCKSGYKQSDWSSNGYDSIMTCVSRCKVDQSWNSLTQQCVDLCPYDYFYDLNSHSCVYRCQENYKFDRDTQKCVSTEKVCPDPENQFYDAELGGCHSCPSGYKYNKNTRLCERVIHECPSGSFYDSSSGLCKQCQAGQTYNPVTKVCQYNRELLNCPSDQFYDLALGRCRECYSGETYDSAIEACRQKCTLDEVYNYKDKECMLISATCNQYEYYDAVKRSCVSKPICSSLQRYDQNTRTCQDLEFITARNAPNTIHSDYTQYLKDYQTTRRNDPNLKDCPQQSPYYSTPMQNCVKCPETHPYFNLETHQCQDCGNDLYSATLRRCVATGDGNGSGNGADEGLIDDSKTYEPIDYSLDRLMMNIV